MKLQSNMKKMLPLKFKQYIKSYFLKNNINHYKNNKLQRKIFIVLAADYGNLGDVAISYAQYNFLRDSFPSDQIIDVPISRNLPNIRFIKSIIQPNDIITIVGGGNFTNKYQEIENFRLKWVTSFPNNKIISFPITIDFTTCQVGELSFKRSKNIYEAHKDFHLFTRESNSLSYAKKNISCPVDLTPDIVLSLNKSQSKFTREGILTCIRHDDESQFSSIERENLLKLINNVSDGKVNHSDTHINKNGLSWSERINELELIWDKFKKANVLITDRLHGMIFAVITKTPCLVLLNNNHKIIQTYKDWLLDCEYIILLTNHDHNDICRNIKILKSMNTNNMNMPNLTPEFKALKKKITDL